MQYIGRSLSFCIRDICENRVYEQDVLCIISSTAAESEHHWNKVLKEYSETIWRHFPYRAQVTLDLFRRTGRIIQPRLIGMKPPGIRGGVWIEVPDKD